MILYYTDVYNLNVYGYNAIIVINSLRFEFHASLKSVITKNFSMFNRIIVRIKYTHVLSINCAWSLS